MVINFKMSNNKHYVLVVLQKMEYPLKKNEEMEQKSEEHLEAVKKVRY